MTSTQVSAVVRCAPPADDAAHVEARREGELVERAKRGDLDAYELLVRQHERFAYRMAYAIVRDAGDAEEATQDAFLKAYRALARFRRGAPFRPWLSKIVINEARSRRRKSVRVSAIAARAIANEPGVNAHDSADAAAIFAEQRNVLTAAIDRLPERSRDVVTCRYLLELSEEETAAALGIRPGTVKSRLSRALAKLEAELSEP